MAEDTLGCIVIAAGMIWGGYWAYTNYEIRKREPVVPTVARPVGEVSLGVGADDAKWSLDADSVTGPRVGRQGWVTVLRGAKDKASFAKSKTLYRVDCDTTAVKELSIKLFKKNGDVDLNIDTPPEKASVRYYPPDSMGGSFVTALCGPGFNPRPAKPE